MKYKVPVDLIIDAPTAEDAAQQANSLMILVYKDLGCSFNLVDYDYPVGYPTEPYDSNSD